MAGLGWNWTIWTKWKGVLIWSSCRDDQGSRDFGVLKYVEVQALHGWFYKGHLFGSWICICMQYWHPGYLVYLFVARVKVRCCGPVRPESVDIVPWAHSPKVHRYLRMWFSSSRGKLAPILNYRTTCQWHKPQPVQLLKLYLIMFPTHKSCSTHRSRSGAPHTFRASNVKHLLYDIF